MPRCGYERTSGVTPKRTRGTRRLSGVEGPGHPLLVGADSRAFPHAAGNDEIQRGPLARRPHPDDAAGTIRKQSGGWKRFSSPVIYYMVPKAGVEPAQANAH